MSRMKLLLDVVNGLRSLADDIQTLADAMNGNDAMEQERVETMVTPSEETQVPPSEPEKAAVTLEEVRATLATKSREGLTAEIRELLRNHGADKLSEVDPAEYPALLAEAEALTDGG